jgi:drug/metabolite transporter (DMT)-like permease
VLPVSRIIAFQFLQPFAGALIAYLLLGEHFTIWLFAGGITIMYGVYLVNRK